MGTRNPAKQLKAFLRMWFLRARKPSPAPAPAPPAGCPTVTPRRAAAPAVFNVAIWKTKTRKCAPSYLKPVFRCGPSPAGMGTLSLRPRGSSAGLCSARKRGALSGIVQTELPSRRPFAGRRDVGQSTQLNRGQLWEKGERDNRWGKEKMRGNGTSRPG